jgi:hypothetical protein
MIAGKKNYGMLDKILNSENCGQGFFVFSAFSALNMQGFYC